MSVVASILVRLPDLYTPHLRDMQSDTARPQWHNSCYGGTTTGDGGAEEPAGDPGLGAAATAVGGVRATDGHVHEDEPTGSSSVRRPRRVGLRVQLGALGLSVLDLTAARAESAVTRRCE